MKANPLEVVLDTVSLLHILRAPKVKGSKRAQVSRLETVLDGPMKKSKLILRLDTPAGLLSEWKQTCGTDAVEVVFTRWTELKAIRLVEVLPKLNPSVAKRLRLLGFRDTTDKIVLRLSLDATDHVVISDDNDFWNPADPADRGKKNAPVARLCREELGVRITLLKPIISEIQ